VRRSIVVLAALTGLLAVTAAPVAASSSSLRVEPKEIKFGTRRVGSETFKAVTVTNRSKSTVLVYASAGLPDDFGFGLLPGSTCPALGAEPLAPHDSCDAVVRFTPTAFFAGHVQHGQLFITATDPATGTVVETVEVPITAKGVEPAHNRADLALTKTGDRKKIRVGENITFTIKLTNRGPAAATGVVFGDSLPDALNLVSFACSQGTVVTQSFCAVDEVKIGASVTAVVVATPITNLAESERRISNTAFVSASATPDPRPANNTASAVTKVVGEL
jgi:uncharacterized repeat protein (TIGR01451 family)